MSTSSIERHLRRAAQEQARAGAACWLARLHRREPPPYLLARFDRWLAERPAHATAWCQALEVWESSAGARFTFPASAASRAHSPRD
jgi:ferric-dicitrate binding protein FerR (iron transport regulator)